MRATAGSGTNAGRADAGFRHEALLYAGDDAFVRGTTSFIRQGVEADEPVLVVVDANKIERLRGALGHDAEAVRFADMADVGRNPARIIPAWRAFADEHAGRRPFRGIGEPIWASRSAAELVECQRHESLLNLAFAVTPDFRLLCPYDTVALPPEVIDEAHRSHAILVEDGVEWPSTRARSLAMVAAPFDRPLPPPPADAASMTFGRDDLRTVRAFVLRAGADAGIGERRRMDLVLAVNEVATNSVRHAGGRGALRAWSEPNVLLFDVRDEGFIDEPMAGRERPTVEQDTGRGLWLANQLCELVQVRTSRRGSVVRLHMALDEPT